MNVEEILDKMVTEEGRRFALLILARAGIIQGNEEGEIPQPVEEGLSDDELDLIDQLEFMLQFDYEYAYSEAFRLAKTLMHSKKFKSALYVCNMIGDELLRREILKNGLVYYESIGDFKSAEDFARMLGDTERQKVYGFLADLVKKIG
jgi:hypothetical protein